VARYDRSLPLTKDTVIPPPDVDPDPNDAPTPGTTGGGAVTDAPPDPSSEAAVTPDAVDEAELDARWGFAPSEPLVGHGAPPVVAVMVTSDPGDWFEESLRSLARQDYENLSILVIDNGSDHDPTSRIADVLPSAYVKRLGSDEGFSSAVNDSIAAVEGSAFHLVLHDDVRLAPNAVTTLVSEAFRANAGVVGPKLVDWDDPTRLDSVGYSVDPYGFASSIAERDELDQSQHDIARQVFAVSDACLLIRSDLFRAIGGFAEEIPFFGEDIDLCWRAHVAGASVHFAPTAVVAHRRRFTERRVAENRERLQLRHQARTMLANYEPFRVVRALPMIAVLSFVDLVGSLVLGRFRRAGDVVAAWSWNLFNLRSLFRMRSRVKRMRRAHDADYLPLMRQGSTRLATLVRLDEGESRLQSAAMAGRGYLKELTAGSNRTGVTLGVVAALLFLVGMRDLFTGPLPVLRELFDPGDSAGQLLWEWWSGWRAAGLGEATVPPAVVPGLGVAGTVLLGSVGLARRLLFLLPLLLGALGAWKLFVVGGSIRSRAAAFAAYSLNPVVLNAASEGRLSALTAYGVAPWLLRRVARSAGLEPFADPSQPRRPALRAMAGSALMLALVTAVNPLGAAILIVTTAVFSLAAATGRNGGAGRMLLHVLGATVMALPASLPWLLRSVTDGDLASSTGLWAGRGDAPSAAELVTGDLGQVTVSWFGWGLVVAAAYALLAGRSWRFGWAAAGWIASFAAWVGAVLLLRADLAAGAGVELVLIPAVLGLAVAVAMGSFAFEHDVVGSDFGLSQLLSGVAVLGLVAVLVPVGVASADGRWYQPEGDFRRLLRVVDEGEDFRTVWIGDPDVLPLAGWELDRVDGVAVGLSNGLDPTVTQRYRLDGGPGAETLTRAVDAALHGETARLGRLLAPMGVRYVIAVDRPAPQPFAPRETPVPDAALDSLRSQLDLSEIDINPSVALFRVSDPWPLRGVLPSDAVPGESAVSLAEQLQSPLPVPEPALAAGRGPVTRMTGELRTEGIITQAANSHPGWELHVDGEQADQEALLGWGQRFGPTGAGDAELTWITPWWARALQAAQVVGLLALVLIATRRTRLVARGRRRRRSRSSEPLLVVGTEDAEDRS
jgi:GT2 family glycosyltransferase